jgi:protein-L-isoaspartate(D-aspartate) O-methyltransferase
MLLLGCIDPVPVQPRGASAQASSAAERSAERERMVREQIAARDVRDRRVLAVMAEIPRHEFVPTEQRALAYRDHPLPIGGGQTISQPYVVALMSELLDLGGDERVLEIGTGSGYQAAVLSRLAKAVYTIEIDAELAAAAATLLARLGYDNVQVKAGDGFFGWPDAAPFDAIIITAATPRIPDALLAQLREGGRVVAPVERRGGQELELGIKRAGRLEMQRKGGVRFVPMTGEIQKK